MRCNARARHRKVGSSRLFERLVGSASSRSITGTSSEYRRRRAGRDRRGCRSPGRSRRSSPGRTRRSRRRGPPAPRAWSGAWMCWTIQPSAPSSLHDRKQVDHPLERAARGPDPLDRRDLRLDGEDRLDLQRRAEPRLGAGDPPAAAQVLERVDREPQLQLGPGSARPLRDRLRVGAVARRRPRRRARPGPGRRRRWLESTTWTRSALRHRAARGPARRHRTVPDIPPARWIETMSLPGLEQRLVHGQEVADRGLRGGRQIGGRPQPLVVGVVAPDLALRA